MKKIIQILALAMVGIAANADSITFTNSTGYNINWWLVPTMDSPEDETRLVTAGAYAVTNNTTGWFLYAADTEGSEAWLPLPSSSGDYIANLVNISSDPVWTPAPIPEPTAFAIFMLGFGLTFATGMIANAAHWVKRIVVGSSNE